jgi:hypothetical protein
MRRSGPQAPILLKVIDGRIHALAKGKKQPPASVYCTNRSSQLVFTAGPRRYADEAKYKSSGRIAVMMKSFGRVPNHETP